MANRWVQLEPGSGTVSETKKHDLPLLKSVTGGKAKPRYTRDEVEQILRKAARKYGITPSRPVEKLDFDGQRGQRQQQLEKSMSASREVTISSADETVVFVDADGRESARSGKQDVAKKRRTSFENIVDQPATEPYTYRSTSRQRRGR